MIPPRRGAALRVRRAGFLRDFFVRFAGFALLEAYRLSATRGRLRFDESLIKALPGPNLF